MNLPFVLISTLLTVLCWGAYGPLMHHGKEAMDSALRPFVGVGLAYFLIAVLVPTLKLVFTGEKGHWQRNGAILSLMAGAVGALGALGVIYAFKFGGSPVYVMPLVFGGAPVINTIVTMGLSGTYRQVNLIFLIGVVTVVLGAAGVLYFKPAPKPHAAPTTPTEVVAKDSKPAPSMSLIYGSIAVAVFCWGSYGPVLHVGQSKMGGSRLRPFLCVGIAYFVIAVALPLIMMSVVKESGEWNQPGLGWSLAGGAAGAIGALGIILAFNFGGRPIFVMPLVFGLAPVMNSVTSITEAGSWGMIRPEFVIALVITICGAVTVLVFAPKPGKPGVPVTPQATLT